MKLCLIRISALLLSILLLISSTASFAFAAEPAQPETQQTVTQTELKDMAIVSGGVANYTVVRSENASSRTVTTVAQLIKRIENYTGIRPKQTTDWHKEGTSLDSDSLEILVGHTAYPESAEALKGVGYGDYVVKQIGNAKVGLDEPHGGNPAQTYDDLRLNEFDLGTEVIHAGILFLRQGIAVLGGTAFEDVGNVDIFPGNVYREEVLIQQLAGTAHKRNPRQILLFTRSFSHKEQVCLPVSCAENAVGAGVVQNTFVAGFAGFF